MNRKLKAVIAMSEAEDRGVCYLAALSEDMAKVMAVKTAASLAEQWDTEKDDMLRRGDRRLVYLAGDTERQWLASAVATYQQHPLWHSCPEQELRKLMADLPPDAAAFVAYKVAHYVCEFMRFS
jgi:hypothetical protein